MLTILILYIISNSKQFPSGHPTALFHVLGWLLGLVGGVFDNNQSTGISEVLLLFTVVDSHSSRPGPGAMRSSNC